MSNSNTGRGTPPLPEAQSPQPDDEELARWLQESGRRKTDHTRTRPDAAKATGAEASQPKKPNCYVTRPSLLILLSLAAVSYLQYYYVDVYLQIALLRHVIVFVPT